MTTAFREPAQPKTTVDQPPREGEKTGEDVGDFKPVENEQDVLEALGVLDDIKILPPEDYEDFKELKGYLESYMEEKGLAKTLRGYRKGIESLKEEMGLHKEADPQAVIQKIGGIAKSWKELSFVRDVEERKRILVRLLGASSQREMDRIVFKEMQDRRVWDQ